MTRRLLLPGRLRVLSSSHRLQILHGHFSIMTWGALAMAVALKIAV